MGKIFNALERQKKEKQLHVEQLRMDTSERSTIAKSEVQRAMEICEITGCDPKLVVISTPESVDAENFKLLRSQILFSREKKPRTIMVTSTFPGEGKTFVSANLAASIALGIDEHVLLVDCDLRRLGLNKLFGLKGNAGLHEYLIGKDILENLLVKSSIGKLSILPAGSVPRNPSELLSSRKMDAFLEEVKGRYQDRYVVLDSGPSYITSEVNVLARHVDGIILVIMAQKAPRGAIKTAVQNLGKEKILGVVFNGYSRTDVRYKKYYKEYYKRD